MHLEKYQFAQARKLPLESMKMTLEEFLDSANVIEGLSYQVVQLFE